MLSICYSKYFNGPCEMGGLENKHVSIVLIYNVIVIIIRLSDKFNVIIIVVFQYNK